MDAPPTSGSVHPQQPMRLECLKWLPTGGDDEDDQTLFLPLIRGPSDYPRHPPQVEPGPGEYFPCSECCDTECTDGLSNWLLVDHHIEYDVWGGGPCYDNCDVAAGDPVVEVTARIKNDSDVDYWTFATGTSYDAEGSRLTGTIWPTPPPFPNTQLVHAHETGDFTFRMKSHHAIALIRISAACASVWPYP
jgi:hypothetical protein